MWDDKQTSIASKALQEPVVCSPVWNMYAEISLYLISSTFYENEEKKISWVKAFAVERRLGYRFALISSPSIIVFFTKVSQYHAEASIAQKIALA